MKLGFGLIWVGGFSGLLLWVWVVTSGFKDHAWITGLHGFFVGA